jgi:SHS2 domain-containing protein
MPFHYREDIATADVAFDVWGRTLEELFMAAAAATIGVMVEKPETVLPMEVVAITLENEALDLLLFNFLNELIFIKDARRLLLLPETISITETNGMFILHSTLHGEMPEPVRHQLNVDVKAVTLHRFSLAQTAEGWRATVVLDI